MSTIGVDLDGCVADFDGAWRRLHALWFDSDVNTRTSKEWADVEAETGWTMAGVYHWLEQVPAFWTKLDPIPGALGGLWRLRNAGHHLAFITNRPDWAFGQTRIWLNEHGFAPSGSTGISLHFVGKRSKSVVPAAIYVDDSPHVLADLKSRVPYAVRFVQPWNDGAPGIEAASWTDVVDIVDRMSQGTGLD